MNNGPNDQLYLKKLYKHFDIIPYDLIAFIKEKRFVKYHAKYTISLPPGITGGIILFFDRTINFFNTKELLQFKDIWFTEVGINDRKKLIPFARITNTNSEHGMPILSLYPTDAITYKIFLFDEGCFMNPITQSLESFLQENIVL